MNKSQKIKTPKGKQETYQNKHPMKIIFHFRVN